MVAIQLVPQHRDAATLIFYGTKERDATKNKT
jgi:hypothetical protein